MIDDSDQSNDSSSDLHLTDEEFEDLETAEPNVALINYSGQDFDVDGLVRRLNNKDIVVPSFGLDDETIETAGFQRGFVWTKKQMDRFIESLLLGYPIPGLFLVRQSDKRYLVLDGQQRLRTLQAFRSGVHNGKVFSLANVADEFDGLTYGTLPEPLRRTFDDSFLQATVVSTDGSRESLDAVYQIFERLNSGGTQLTPHEIRVALYAGPLIAEIERLNTLGSWRILYGLKKNARLRDQELILRSLALYLALEKYSRPLKGFLNDFAGEYRELDGNEVREAAQLFERATALLAEGPGAAALRKGSGQVNAAQSEAILVGLMQRLASGDLSTNDVSSAISQLTNNENFDAATTRSTADEQVVQARVRIATKIFGEV